MTMQAARTTATAAARALLNARLIDPGTGLDETGGVLVEDGTIVDLRPGA